MQEGSRQTRSPKMSPNHERRIKTIFNHSRNKHARPQIICLPSNVSRYTVELVGTNAGSYVLSVESFGSAADQQKLENGTVNAEESSVFQVEILDDQVNLIPEFPSILIRSLLMLALLLVVILSRRRQVNARNLARQLVAKFRL